MFNIQLTYTYLNFENVLQLPKAKWFYFSGYEVSVCQVLILYSKSVKIHLQASGTLKFFFLIFRLASARHQREGEGRESKGGEGREGSDGKGKGRKKEGLEGREN